MLATEGVHLPAPAVSELFRRTGGWPAAVYLAALSLAGRDNPQDLVDQLSGTGRFIADYLTEKVLVHQDPEVRDFMLDMSLFDRFNTSLGNHVTQTQASGRLLQRLQHTNLLQVTLDDAGGWVRFHPIFATLASSTLEVSDPDRARDLHHRGAGWFADRDLIDEAVRHYLRGDAAPRAAALVQANWLRYVETGRTATVLEWLDTLHASTTEHSVHTTVTAAWVAALTGHPGEMTQRLRLLETVTDDTPLPDGTSSARSAVVLIRGLCGYDGPDRMLADAREAVSLETSQAAPWYAVARAALGHAAYVVGDLQQARDHLSEAASASAAPSTIRMLALATMSLCDLEHGTNQAAARSAAAAMRLVEDHGLQALPQAVVAYTAEGACLAASGEADQAWEALQTGLRLDRQIPGLSPWPLIHHLIITAAVAAQTDRPAMAEDLLDEVTQLCSWTDATMTAMHTRIAQARQSLPQPRTVRTTLGEPLTAREAEILRRLRGPQTLQDIANDLHLSRNTIKTFTGSLYRKLGAHSRSEAIAIARRTHLL